MQGSADTTADAPGHWLRHGEALGRTPMLSLVCALGAWGAMIVQKALIPGLHGRVERATLVDLSLAGEFGANLAAVAGAPALMFACYDYWAPNPVLSLTRRMTVAGLSVIVVGATLFATYFDRTQRIGQMVFYGLGATHLLVVILMMAVVLIASARLDRVLALGMASAGLFGLMGHVADLFSRRHLPLTTTANWLHGFGEMGYLTALLAVAWGLTPTEREGRRGLIRFVTFVILGGCATGLSLAQNALGSDFSLVLYNAQRLRLMLDTTPLFYAVPLSAAAAAAFAGLLARPDNQRQLAVAALLMLAGGYLPQGPVQLLSLALAAMLMSRALAARNLGFA